MGRNTPHFYGAGLIEMIGEQTRRKILNLYDQNKNGVIDRAEVKTPRPVRIIPAPGLQPVDYGDLSPGADGIPRLNSIFRVWYLDARHQLVNAPKGLNDTRVAAFGFAMQPLGWGRGYRVLADGYKVSEGGEASTLRGIYTLASDVHLGLQAFDPTQQGKAGGESENPVPEGGEAGVSLNGALQYDFGTTPDRGRARTTQGVSLDDPDGDGQIDELTEGDVDAAEFYMLHAPAPATRASSTSEQGRIILHQLRCISCHAENWKIEAVDRKKGYAGDRRLFHLATRSLIDEDGSPQIVGSLVATHRRLSTGEYVARGGAFLISRLYSDFKHWNIGPNFYERRYDGSLQQEHRTAPLWGIGSTAPYGHAGQYPTLDEVISAHGGAAQKQRDAYLALAPNRRRLLLDYLQSLVLYATDEIDADINNDGLVSERYKVAGQYVGYERFDARFLFAVAPRYKYLYTVKDYLGREIPLSLIDNVAEAYRLNLLYRRDEDGDGFPDMLGPVPLKGGARR
ncbi:MAG TPA: di-heme oxidoredictase family protein [Pyrinomonadaceae bacterium]|jgi:hypothetical protein